MLIQSLKEAIGVEQPACQIQKIRTPYVSGPAAVVTVLERALGESEKVVEAITEVFRDGVDGSMFCWCRLNEK